jgi:hypothetical protein
MADETATTPTTPTAHVETVLPTAVSEPDPTQRPARLALYVGIILVIVGASALYLGYNGAATNPLVQAQIPFVISGGLVGLGLLALGGISLAMSVILSIQSDFRTELNTMRESIEHLSEAVSYQAFGGANGSKQATDIVMVARGSTSFHRKECRLVERSEHSRPLPRDEADREGMLPCRICKP